MGKKALIIIDLQNDFCKGGSLTVPEGDAIVPVINQLQPYFDLIIATQDWHPKDHVSFASNHPGVAIGDELTINKIPQILWPDHCIQYSKGSQFHPELNTSKIHKIFHKGIEKEVDSYSAFFDNAHLRATGLGDYLNGKHVKDIYISGLATDYCVKFSVLDAAQLGFNVFVIEDACRGVELKPGDTQNAFAEMRAAGATVIRSSDIKK